MSYPQDQDWKAFFIEQFVQGPVTQHLVEDPVQSVLVPWLQVVEVVHAERTSAGTGTLTVRFPVQHEYLNPGGSLQGGIQTAMYDVISSWVFMFAQGWPTPGVSRTLTTAYIRPALEGEVVLMHCELVHAGKRLGLSKGTITKESDGKLISTCEHHKYNSAADSKV